MTHLAEFLQDVRHAIRGFRRHPGFACTVIASLAIGIGINGAVFTVANAVLFKGFPLVHENDRVLYVTTSKNAVYYPDFDTWRTEARSFAGMALVRGVNKTFSGAGATPETFFTTEITAGAFRLLGVQPVLGRDFTPSDQQAGATPVVMLRYDFWQRQLGGDPSIVGQSIRLNGEPTTVIGVMPQGFSFPEDQHLWTPLIPTPASLQRDGFYARYAFARLTDGATISSARTELETIASRLARTYPATNDGLVPIVRSFDDAFIGARATMLYEALWGAAGFVMLIVWCNLSNLFLERALGRAREVSVRLALGAGRWRLIRQLVVESLVLSCAGGIAGWWLAALGVRAFTLAQGTGTTRVLNYAMDIRVAGYLVALSVATGLFVGVAAALRLTRVDVNGTLKDGGRGITSGPSGRRLSNALIAAEMTLAVVLLTGAGVMIRSFLHVYAADLGVNPANVLTMSMYVPPEAYPDDAAQIDFYQRLNDRLAAVPGVEAVGLGAVAPTERAARSGFEIEGRPSVAEAARPTVADLVVDPGYFRALGTKLITGREFNDLDDTTAMPVAIVNQRFASLHWPGESPVGKRVRLFREGRPQRWLTVAGVASNVVQNDATRQAFEPLVYVPYRQRPQPNMFVFARTRVAPANLAHAFARAIYAIDPRLPVPAPLPLTERFSRAYALERNVTALFLIFAGIALLLAAIGLYATVAHSVSARTHEIGIRTALGAARRDIRTLVFRVGLLPACAGLAIGLIASIGTNRLLQAQLVRVSPADPLTLVTACIVLVAAATIGCMLPARRALRVDPVVALRHE